MGGITIRRLIALVGVAMLGLVACTESETSTSPATQSGSPPAPSTSPGPADATVAGQAGSIVFARFDSSLGSTVIYTVNPDGSDLRPLFTDFAEFPHWSPDGDLVSIFCCEDGMAAHFVDPDTGSFRELAPPDPSLEVHCGNWSSDGQRVACESFGVDDPRRNGIYSIRTSDGKGLKRITSNPGGEDAPGDYSPDGQHLVFIRSHPNGEVGLFVVGVDGSDLHRLVPASVLVEPPVFFAGSWSPNGDEILFVARASPGRLPTMWVVNADGSGLHQLSISPACGGAASDLSSTACLYPGWSPDGTKIIFTRVEAGQEQGNIYGMNGDGSGLFQITDTGDATQPDWNPLGAT
jgi:Tol biopolymer transport system component